MWGEEKEGSGAASEGRARQGSGKAARIPSPPIDMIARRVERIRDLRFETTRP